MIHRALLAVSLGWSAMSNAAKPPPRLVFAHYMVCIPTHGGGSEVADYQREIREAQARGIDGFALNCGGWTACEPHYKKRTLLIYQAARELDTDFQLFLSADYATGLTLDETRDMIETFRNHPNQFRWQGKPVLSTFGGGRRITEFVKGPEFQGQQGVFFVPFYYPKPAAEMPNREQAKQVLGDHPELDGFFHFGAAGSPERIARSNRILAEVWHGAGKLFMAPVTPFYRGFGGNYRAYECRGFEGLARQWEGAIEAKAEWVEIVTWNDWGEASYISPFGAPKQTEFWKGHWGAMLDHRGFLDLSAYYIQWYKTGKAPAITKDRLFYAYQLHPRSVQGIVKPGKTDRGRPRGADQLADRVFATVLLTAPADLTLAIGEQSQTFALAAGVHHVSVPLVPGTPRFTLGRAGKTVIDKTGEHSISPQNAWANFNIFTGSAE
jgi:glucan endo-1,3-alpha-glucosidase